jgi:endogenous inhibitor of DNA gyrase (YacG/DUF329 family)
MIRGRCPLCSGHYEIATLDDLPSFPFCSRRCRLIDLGRWIDEDYVVSETRMPDQPAERPDAAEPDDPAIP